MVIAVYINKLCNMTESKSKQNPPSKHHYIPAFYTKRWTGDDGKLIVYSKPHNEVIDRRLYPDATGYHEDLYSLKGAKKRIQIEDSFFKPVDVYAHQVLSRLEQFKDTSTWTMEMRSNWTRFIMSLLFRCPYDLEFFRERWKYKFTQTDAHFENEYAQIKTDDAPATLKEYLSSLSELRVEQSMFKTYQDLIENEHIGSYINSMNWYVLDTSKSNLALLTSDCPVIRTNGIKYANSYLVMPIGPTRLFIAANNDEVLLNFKRTHARDLVKQINRIIVRRARRFVYANEMTKKEFDFIKLHFGQSPQSRLIEEMQHIRT